MATAIGMGFDVSALLDSIKNADKALGDLMSKSNQASKSIINAFQQMSSQGVGAYVESLEKQIRLYQSINAVVTETSGKAKKGYEEMKSGVDTVVNSLNDMIKILQQTNLYKEYKIKLVSDEELAKIKAYQTELSNLFNSEMQYSQRMQAIKEANVNKTQRELEEYKKLSSEIERLQKLQSSATYELNKPTSMATYNAAKDVLPEIERQLADHKARMVELERKYEAEILVINQQGSIARFEEIRKAERKDLDANEKYKKDKEKNINSLAFSYERESEALKRKVEAEENAQKRIQALAQQAMDAQRSFVERRVNDANKVAQAEHEANQKTFQEALKIQQQALERFARNEHEKREEIKRTRDAGLEAAQALDKAQAKTESLNRAKNYQRTQKYGDTSSQALAAYDRLVSGKGQLSVNNMQDVLSKLEQAQNKINLKTSEGRERYNELEAAIKKVKATIDSVVNAEENAAKKRAKNANEAKKHEDEARKLLEKRLKLLKDIAAEQSKSRSSLYRLTQSSGDTTKQAQAAYNRIYGDKGIQSIKNFGDVLSKLESAQVKINQRTEDGRKKYEEFDKMIQRVKKSIQDLSTTDSAKAEALRNAQAKTNQQTKDNSARIKSERDAMYKMYEQMFDNIAKKNGQTAEQVVKKNQEELRQRRKYVNEMTTMYERMFDEIAKKEGLAKKRQIALDNARGDSSKGALNYYNRLYSDKGVKSINNMNTALQKLRDAQSKLNLKTEEGKKKYDKLGEAIKRIEKDMAKLSQQSEKVNKKHSQLLDIIGQLQRRLALVFSVSQITGYINKIVKVRGEFELQQRALQAIVQNVDEANKLWDKTVALAVKSPFRVKELVTYTKQLAAYRIETSQLYDTTKRLADVSAGLGVDMQRLILAYGQVRAASFLRGTELRQFTEAGIPMLEELAKHFTELEGRAISVGDVFERISKRMVTFEDVSAVFQRMTNDGGVFYDMQAKQSETLKGQISNLHDAIDLMMNDIGKANEEGLKNAVLFARKLVDNWKDVVDAGKMWLTVLSPLITRTVLFKTANSGLALSMLGLFNQTKIGLKTSMSYGRWLVDLEKKSRIAAWGVRGLTTALRGIATIGIAAIGVGLISWVTDLYLEMTKASREAARFKKELNGIISEDISIIEKNSNAYRDLYTRLNTLNKGTQARKDIINKLNSQYGEYLGFVVDEETSVEKLANAYDDVVKKMQEKQSLATFEKGISAISESYGNALSEAKDEFYDLFKGASIKSNKNDFSFIVPTKKEIDDIYTIIQQRSREMSAEQLDDLNEQSDLIQQIVKNYYGEEFYLSRDFNVSIELLNILVRKKKQELELQKEINLQYRTVLKSRDANLALEKLQLKYAEKRREAEKNAVTEFERQKELTELATQEKLDIIDVKVEFGEIDKESAERAKNNIINWATELNKSINNTIKIELGKEFSEEELSKVLITESMQKSQSSADYVKNIKSSWETQNQIIKEQISLKSEGLKVDENILTSALKAEKLYRKTAEILGVELDYVEKLDDETRNAINSLLPEEYQISLEQAYGGIDKIIADLKKEEAKHLNIIEQINERKKEGLPINEQELKDAEDGYWWTKKRMDLIDPKTKTPIKEGKVNTINAKLEEKYQIDAVDRTKDEVTLLSEANSEKEKAIAYEKQLNAQKEQGHNITKEELDSAKRDVEQYTILWKLLGGTEKDTGSSNSLYDERIKVVDDLNKKYKELNKKLDKSTSLQGAFEAYIDAFADAYEGISWIPKNVREMSPEEFSEKVLNFPNEDALVSFLNKLANEPMKAFEKIKIELAKGKYVYDAKVRVQVEEDKSLIDSIEDMFGNYEVSLELGKLNIPPDLAKRLFGVDAIDLSTIRKEIESKLATARASGGQEDLVKKLEEQLEKVENLEDKALKERLKRYSQFLVKGQSERVKVKLEELRELEKLEKDYENKEIDEGTYRLAQRGIQKEAQEKLDKLEWEEFKDSDMYIRLFEDLEYASNKSLSTMKSRLKEFKDSLKESPSDIKEITNALEKLDEQAIKNNPFKGLTKNLGEYIKHLKERKKLEEEHQKTLLKEEFLKDEVKEAEDAYTISLLQYENISNKKDATKEEKDEAFNLLQINELTLDILLAQLVATQKISEEEARRIKNGEKAKKGSMESLQGIASEISAYADAIPQIAENLEHVFGSMDSKTRDTIESISEIANSTAQLIEGVASENWANAAVGASGIFKGIFNINDKKQERKIQEQVKLVKELEYQYEKLEKQINEAYTTEDLKGGMDGAKENIDAQIDSYEKMIAAEEGKKKADKERIEEWRKIQEQLEEQREELERDTIESLGGTYDYKSATREFVDAWIEAFRETGNGLKGLEDNFDEFWENIMLNQAVMNGASKILEPLINEINEALKTDYKVDDGEWDKIENERDTAFQRLNDFMQGWYNQWGDTFSDDSELSGLQRGIQGITEDQADVLASYLNSIRMFVSSNNQLLAQLVNLQGGVASASVAENPMLPQLRIVAQQTTAIRTLLDSVVKTGGHSNGGAGIKVFMS